MELIGTLVSCGHDLNNLIDNYTIEQLEIMSMSIFQHRLTQLKLVAYALGGGEARERVPDSPSQAAVRRARAAAPEVQQKQREMALAQLMQLQGKVGKAARAGGLQMAPDNQVRGDAASPVREPGDPKPSAPQGVDPGLKARLDQIKNLGDE